MKTCCGCFEDEKLALLQLKSSFNSSSPNFTLTSFYQWGFHNEDDCCKWDGVHCSSSTGRLTGLFLDGDYLATTEWKMNATLFLPFQQLTTLSLQDFVIHGCVQNQSFDRLSTLQNLESLDLNYNTFKDKSNILSSIGTISSLKSLSLISSQLNSDDDIEALASLTNLELLDLTYNNFDNSIFSIADGFSSLKSLYLGWNSLTDIKGLSKLVNLEVLDLSRNNFNNTVLLSLASLSSLKQLYLSFCGLTGTIDLEGAHKNLNLLFLDYNTPMDGSSNIQLHSLGAYPNLKTISLRGNNFQGPIFIQEKEELFNLEELVLDDSSLDDKSFESLNRLSSLKRLSLRYAQLNGTLPLKGFCNLRNLEELDLSSNELSGELPWCIGNLTSLQKLDLSNNHFIGSISPLRSMTSLEELRFSGNLFQVPLSLEPFFNHSKLKYFDGEGNHVIFQDMEVHVSAPKFQLEFLSLFNTGNGTRIGGGFPKFLWHQHDLQQVDLSNIQLQGEFPYWLLDNNTRLETLNLANTSLSGPLHLQNHSHEYLGFLDISNNDLNGSIPTQIGQLLPNLRYLNLSGNGLTGGMPSSFIKMKLLEFVDLSSNRLSGEIPADLEIGSFGKIILSNNHFEGQIFLKPDCGNNNLFDCNQLEVFDVSNNRLSGKIPRWIANMSSLQVLDLSKNRFSGSLPEQLGPSNIREVYLSENMLQGSLETSFINCYELVALDLSHNYFSGTIPKWIGKLPNLSYLLMGHNNLEGELPVELCSLQKLSLLDLSNNNLYGHVLSCIKASDYTNRGPPDLSFNGAESPMVMADAPVYMGMEQPVEFTTKSRTDSYQGSILRLISGIDLSCNNFSGIIPYQIGNLPVIHVLNLSHNSLIGRIPESFSNLAQIESLDLSYNKLYGKISSQLLQLHYISHFSVAHNNLSGRTPERVRQFATFESSSYEGNPSLCGPPLLQNCSSGVPPSPNYTEEEEDGFMDMEVFYVSCVVTYFVVLCSFAVVLYVNPYWRRRWFYMIEVMLRNGYYFIEDHVLFPLFKLRAS
ncbi:Receptor-like protein 13 [Euphorbia peplus]|nr:Receptor-like protein 13 [Euphorbia peplus]